MPNPFARALTMSVRPSTGIKSMPPEMLGFHYVQGSPVFSTWDGRKAVSEGYALDDTVRACVDRRSDAISSAKWYVEQRMADDEWERVPGHPIEDLLSYPNPDYSRQDLFETLSKHCDLLGNAVIETITIPSSKGRPVELWPLDPARIAPIPGRTALITAYKAEGRTDPIPAADVIHFMFRDPSNPLWGMPPLRSIARVVDTKTEAVRWNKLALGNRGVPDGVFTFEQPLSQEDWEAARVQVDAAYTSPDNARRPMIFGSGAKWQQTSWKPIEMDFTGSIESYRVAICSVYGILPPMIGLMQDATLANTGESRKSFWEDTVLPLLDSIEATLNRALLPRFERRRDFRICYDVSHVRALREDYGEKVKQYATLVEHGQPPNAAAKRLAMDLDDVPGGDTPLVPANLIALTDVVNMSNEPAVTEQPRLDAGKALAADHGQIVRHEVYPGFQEDFGATRVTIDVPPQSGPRVPGKTTKTTKFLTDARGVITGAVTTEESAE